MKTVLSLKITYNLGIQATLKIFSVHMELIPVLILRRYQAGSFWVFLACDIHSEKVSSLKLPQITQFKFIT
jgi:hypothetical protein